jgi:FKBP-type peptidyl-prolyl cis-trans isomerase FklB
MATARWLIFVLLLHAAFAVQAQGPAATGRQQAPQPAPVKIDKYKLSYAIGYHFGSQIFGSNFPADVDINVLQKAIEDGYAKRTPTVPKEDMYEQLNGLDKRIHDKAVSEFNRIATDNAHKGADFMAYNAKQPGVVQLPSGIQYSVIKKGPGTINPGLDSVVTIDYRGMLVDGTEFDSTQAHGHPVTFTVSDVIRGWQFVIPRMHVGDRWEVVIPPTLAYGARGLLPRIGPNQTLVFDIELLDIKQPKPQAMEPQLDVTH